MEIAVGMDFLDSLQSVAESKNFFALNKGTPRIRFRQRRTGGVTVLLGRDDKKYYSTL